ncbi:MAG: acyl-CoA desaturase [Proteobacteria bacterium]|nr:acyl-CoA desaturase [Pseudomonadota bacterium]
MASPAEALPMTSTPAPGRRYVDADGVWHKQRIVSVTLYWGIHAACLLTLVTGVSALDLGLCVGLFWLRMFGITGGYHRYFAHRAFQTSRAFQFVLAVLGTMAVQKGPLWWASTHRVHHRNSDQPGDVHSPRDGFWHSHSAWIFDGRWDDTDLDGIRDFAKFPELVWLNQWHVVGPLLLAVLCFAIGGFSGLIWGFAVSTTLLWHSTYTINSLAHRWGSKRYETGDDSRNNLFLALLTFGEGWHNNHHHYMASARNGFFWWEIDITYYLLRGLEKLGLVWELRIVPKRLLHARRVRVGDLREAA